MKSDPLRVGVAVGDPISHEDGYSYKIFFGAAETLTYPESKLKPCVEQVQALLSHRDFLRDLLLLKLRQPLSDNLYSYQASRTVFRVYQFKPALKFLNSPEQRILIADEVGLGKTIEAGIIYLEMKARMQLDRVLVVCPSGLRDKWDAELRSRFDDEFISMDARSMRRFLDDYDRFGGNTTLKGICSLETLRREDFARALAEKNINFDLVIIDEAHHLRNMSTLSHALGELLADQSAALILLTATPLHTGNEDLFHLMQLINPGEFDSFDDFEERIRPNQFVNNASKLLASGRTSEALRELRKVEGTQLGRSFRANPYFREVVELLESRREIDGSAAVQAQRRLLELNTLARVFNRTRKREVSDAAIRSAHTIKVEFTDDERAFYDAVVEFVRLQLGMRDYGAGAPAFAVIMRERQAASCIQALSARFVEALRSKQLNLHVEDSSSELADEYDRKLTEFERRQIKELLGLCTALGQTDTKFEQFRRALEEIFRDDPECKVLVFSFFRDTLEYLHDRLSALKYKVGTIHGGIPVQERRAVIDEFQTDPETHIMLSSEVGAEGLDFQFCGAMFNYDLPWNPMRVEQRIGRLDRFGQRHEKIHIYNLVIDDTIETRIFSRLYDRIRIFESSIGDLEAILGEEIRQLSREIFMARLTEEEEAQRAEAAARRIERYRQEQEDFEKQRLVFLGQDQLFDQDMEKVREHGRFIAADEVRSLIESFVEQACPKTRLEPDEGDPTYALSPGRDIIDCALTCVSGKPKLGQHARFFLSRLRSDSLIPLTFDAETARERKLVEFVNVHHPLVAFAADFFLSKGVPSPPRTCIWAAGPPDSAGDYVFFIFRLDIRSLVPQSTLIPVLVSLDSGSIEPALSASFLAEIQHRRDETPPPVAHNDGRLQELASKAQAYLSELVREREREVKEQNDALIEARIASLEQSYGFRMANARRQMESVADERIKRMRRSQIDNLKGSLLARKREVESKRQVDIGYDIVASGLVRFVPTLEQAPESPKQTNQGVTAVQPIARSEPVVTISRAESLSSAGPIRETTRPEHSSGTATTSSALAPGSLREPVAPESESARAHSAASEPLAGVTAYSRSSGDLGKTAGSVARRKALSKAHAAKKQSSFLRRLFGWLKK
ncbi:MAG: DEAD/DEAH box helicase family protein [Chloroflexi bacterium]|nr:DEAD/DEAH box helicase family protein [Chloroflexota bacterium]